MRPRRRSLRCATASTTRRRGKVASNRNRGSITHPPAKIKLKKEEIFSSRKTSAQKPRYDHQKCSQRPAKTHRFTCGNRESPCKYTTPTTNPKKLHQNTNQLYFTIELKSQKRPPESSAAAGKVKIQAIAMSRIVESCRPLLFAAIVPATPEESTCVVLTGRP
jgi:hypothetical protein